MRCQLCGFEFDATQMVCHSSCPMSQHCQVVCCPHCGYQAVDPSNSKLVLALRRALEHVSRPRPARPSAPSGRCRLSELGPGRTGIVVAVESRAPSRLDRLSTLGVVPGCRITLEQSRPAYVVRVGFTELSLEREVADEIVVEPA